MELRVTRARKIFSDGKHNAFTGIASFDDRAFVVFRSGTTHISMDGAIKVVASKDMEAWEVASEKSIAGLDLRDPKAVAFNDVLLVYCGSRGQEGLAKSMAFSSTDGRAFGEPAALNGIPQARWLWCIRPFGEVVYGTAYGKDGVALYRSADGLNWQKTVDFPIPGNEVSIDFDPDGKLWALVRDDSHGCIPAVCTAEPPYTSFGSVARLPIRLQGPMLKRLVGGCVIAGRRWDAPGRRNLRMDLFWLEDGQDIRFVRSLPSGGDTSYAGWLDTGEGRGAISYYSSHEHKMDEAHANNASFSRDGAHAEHSTPSDIFLADVSYL